MTSKSCLFKSIKENIQRNMYLLVLITLGFIILLPVTTIMSLDGVKENTFIMKGGMTSVQQEFLNCIGVNNEVLGLFIGVFAVILGVSGFCYLYSGKKTDFYHSLPLKREELFAIPFLSGFLIFLIPYLISVGITYLIGFGYHGVSATSGVSALTAVGMNVLFFLELYVLAILAILLTGNFFTGTLAFLGFMTYGLIVFGTYQYLKGIFFDTLTFQTSKIQQYLNPIAVYINAVSDWRAEKNNLGGYIIYAVLLIVLVLLADICIYKVRPSESFHKSIAFQKLQPIIKVFSVIPLSLFASVLFCSGTGHGFIYLCAFTVLFSLILSCVFEFLFTMDIRKCIVPKISAGVSLVILVIILVGYKIDILGVDSYLPNKEKVETMSVYLPSINGKIEYPEENMEVNKSLENSQVKDFDDIYELAKLSVDHYQNEFIENSDYQVSVVVYVRYHLKSGRIVDRVYDIPETEKLLTLVSNIYDNWEYKKAVLPTSYLSEEDIARLYVDSFRDKYEQIDGSKDILENIYKTYKSELESMTFEQACTGRIIGYLDVEKKEKNTDKYYGKVYADKYYGKVYAEQRDDIVITQFPIYENFTKTKELLEDAGQPLKELSSQDILNVTVFSDAEQEDGKVITDKDEIEKILPRLTQESHHYSLGTNINYHISVLVTFENQNQTLFYMIEE